MFALLFMNRMSILKRKLDAANSLPVKKISATVTELVCCRTCLSKENLEPLFYKDNEIQRAEELRVITGLEINLNDGLSQMICTKCTKSLEAALKFRRKSRKAEKTLIGLLPKLSKQVKPKKIPKQILEVQKQDPELDYHDYTYDDIQHDHEFDNENVDIKPIIAETFSTGPNGHTTEKKPTRRRLHLRIPNAASYKCPTCSKEFRMKATFKAHMRFHTNYCVCEACGKRCRNNIQLQEHKRARHGLGRIHKCAYCEYSSATKEALTIHERRHTGERPYICDHCGATFHRRSNLVQHIAIHLPEKNFQCTKCHIREKSLKRLRIHEYQMHKRKRYRYVCPICNETFARPGNVRRHLERGHGIKRPDQETSIQRIPVTSGFESHLADTLKKM